MKVLITRLSEVLHETISHYQSALLGGRHILDLAVVANEVEEARRGESERLVFNMGFEKACNR